MTTPDNLAPPPPLPAAALTKEGIDAALGQLLQAVAALPEGPRGRQADDGIEAHLSPEIEPLRVGVYFEFRDRRTGQILTADNFELARGRLCLHERLTKGPQGLGSTANVKPLGGSSIPGILKILAATGLIPGGALVAGSLSGVSVSAPTPTNPQAAALALLQSLLGSKAQALQLGE